MQKATIDSSLKTFEHQLIYFCTGCHQNTRAQIEISSDCEPIGERVQCPQCGYDQPILPGDIRDLKEKLKIVRLFRYHCKECSRIVNVKIEFNQSKELKSKKAQCPLCQNERILTEKEQNFLQSVARVSPRAILFIQMFMFFMLVQVGISLMTEGGFTWQQWVTKALIGVLVMVVLAFAIFPVKK